MGICDIIYNLCLYVNIYICCMKKEYAQKHYLPKCILPSVAKLTHQVINIPRATHYRISSYEVSHPIASTLFLVAAVSAGRGGAGSQAAGLGDLRGQVGGREE